MLFVVCLVNFAMFYCILVVWVVFAGFWCFIPLCWVWVFDCRIYYFWLFVYFRVVFDFDFLVLWICFVWCSLGVLVFEFGFCWFCWFSFALVVLIAEIARFGVGIRQEICVILVCVWYDLVCVIVYCFGGCLVVCGCFVLWVASFAVLLVGYC